ncbi:MAG TPA: dynamin family protein [Chthoniobacteraceae bacterium]|jgi:GTPase SAR1 family protein|nr:dynamin family protein [Chthoniobacteraceae bacterium]
MKTGISSFCEACSEALAALPAALESAAAELVTRGSEGSLAGPLSAMNDLRARVRSLTDKLASQQAYLLIFGPLKSGKSTLMNALSGAYVSEVTSLPGYPCLVYVQHAAKKRISVTRYNGRESVSTNGDVLRGVLADGHLALAQQIRAAEQRQVPFDPTADFPEAIRRIDVKLPVPSLEKSSTVLVDTPGLYSRMNFGYDTLTREFRNSAACAVFVVKTDNLFLEQVFEEFNQLLALFSRIFLVINVDSSKRDLQANGELRPSAESLDPDQIVEAFTTLSMNGPLRQAYEQNRVRIHALDLMNAASERILAERPEPVEGAGGADAAEPTDTGRRFEAFTKDLTEYLNSNDYTQEFMRDSVRQARLLCGETLEVVGGREIQEVFSQHEELGARLADLDGKIAAADRLLAIDWESTFQKAKSESSKDGRILAETESTSLAEEMRQALDRWFGSGDSLRVLEEQLWAPLLVHSALTIATGLRTRIFSLLSTAFGGVEATPSMVTDLQRVGLSLSHVAAGSLATLHESESIDPYLLKIAPEKLPVRRTFVDVLLFRSSAKLRRRLFGEANAMPIDPRDKAIRLSNKARLVLLQMIHEDVQPRFAATPLTSSAERLQTYIAGFCGEVRSTLECQREQMKHHREQLQVAHDLDKHFVQQMRALIATTSEAVHRLDFIARRESILPVPAHEPAHLQHAQHGVPQHAAA